MNGERRYRSEDGKEWVVTLEAPGEVLSVPESLEKSGALLPEHAVQIVFTSGAESLSEEYTALTRLEDLDEDELQDWFEAARKGEGL